MKKSEFKELKVGDKVKVRSWAEMEKEFGLDSEGDINTEVCFTTIMKRYCDNVYEVVKTDVDCAILQDGCGDLIFGFFHYSTIELAKEELKEQPKDVPHLEGWLGGKFMKRMGNIGEATPLKDSKGEELNIGDIVLVMCKSINDTIITPVVKDKGKCFIFGIKGVCSPDGKITDSDYYIQKIAVYNEVPIGAKLHCSSMMHYIKYCKGE